MLSLSKAATLPSLISPNANLNLTTPTSLNFIPDLPGEEFRYRADYAGPLLPKIPCIMVCVFALRQLALRDEHFGDEMPPTKWTRVDYPQVGISVDNPGDKMTVRFTMWTIIGAMEDMMGHDQFQTSQFQAWFLHIRIAVLKFFAPNAGDTIAVANRTESAVPQSSGAASTANHSTATRSINLGESELNGTSSNARLRAHVTYRDKQISSRDVFMGIMWAILSLAPHLNNDPVETITIPATGFDSMITTTVVRGAVIPPQIQPLYYGDVISMLAKLPLALVRDDKYCEMDIVMKDNDVTVGIATMRSTPRNGFVESPGTANVSVS